MTSMQYKPMARCLRDTEDLPANGASRCPKRQFGNGVRPSVQSMPQSSATTRPGVTDGNLDELFVTIQGRPAASLAGG
jgi:hypothetical protein